MTQRFTAEWAVRPFLLHHPRLSFATLARWTGDPSAHVRRLVSEGSRPRLPWGMQLKPLIADPSPTLPLLEALQDDPSAYVRRSVANHLNDIAKDHPALVADWLARHLPHAGPERRALLRHASRSLVKRGDAQGLAHWGVGAPLRGDASLAIEPRRVALGGGIIITITLTSRARRPQALLVDYAVHHVKADGRSAPKVFKGWGLELAAGEERVLITRHALKPITTRRYYPGRHRVELLVNGRAVADAAFELVS
jgi:3-methyladenine DNA glycosylase AlkC